MSIYSGAMKKSRITLNEAMELPIANGIPSRKISAKTCEHFGVRAEYDQDTGDVVAYLWPVTKKGNITGFKRRAKDGTVAKKEAFSTIGDVDQECDYIGASVAGLGRKLFVTEGEYDMMALFQVLDEKYQHKNKPCVVSLNLGSGSAAAGANSNIELLRKYKETVLVYDNDEMGQEAVRETALIYPDVKNVVLELKDASDYLKEELNDDLISKVFDAVDYEVEQIHYGALSKEELMRPIPKGVRIERFETFMNKLKGFRPAELTIILAPHKSGKTTLCKAINYELLKHEQPTMGIYLEEDLVKTQQSFIALDHKIHLPKYRMNPSQLSGEEVQTTMDTILNPKWAFFCDDRRGHITPERLMSMLEWAAIKGCKFVILDHISFVFSGLKAGDERKEIDKLLTDIAAYVKKTGVHVIAVSHVVMDKNRKPRKKDGSIDYPYWYEIEDTDARGSGAFAQLCWNMVAIEKQIKEDGTRGHTRLKVLLNREWDMTGKCETLTMNTGTGWLEVVE